MKFTLHRLLRMSALGLTAALALTLAACSPRSADKPAPTSSSSMTPTQVLEMVSTKGTGFSVGPLMAAQTVYVLFDPQCPHCGHLWQAAKPLQQKIRFVWIPVSIINGKSAAQGASLLTAANPSERMDTHEASLLAGTGGLPTSDAVAPPEQATIQANTALFNTFGLDSVPFMVSNDTRTGKSISSSGAMTPQALAQWLGLNAP